jgi:penicillin-binding protein 1B
MEGAKAALPIWTEFMKRAHTHREYRNVSTFEAPEGIVAAEIDPASGQIATNACPQVATDYFISGTQPIETCHLHGGGATQVASWEDAPQPAAPAVSARTEARPEQRAAQRPAARTPQSFPITPSAAPQPAPPQPKKGIWGRIRDIFR